MSDIIYTPPSVASPTGSGSSGQVAFWSASTVLNGDNNLFWDNTNKRLGIGTITPASKLDVFSSTTTNYIYLTQSLTNVSSGTLIRWAGTDYMGFIGNVQTGEFKIGGLNSGGYYLTLYTNNVERARIMPTGNFLINTTTDAGYRFQVNGTAYINNNLYLGNARVGFTQSVPYFDIVASFTGGAGFSIGFVDNNNTNRWATWKYNGSAMSDYTSTPTPVNSSVQFQLDSISRGFLLARMTDAQILAITSPANGLMVYSTDQNVIAFYDGTSWHKVTHTNL